MAGIEDDLLKALSIVDWTQQSDGTLEGHFADETHQLRYQHLDQGDVTVDAYVWTQQDKKRSFISLAYNRELTEAGCKDIPDIYRQATLVLDRRKTLPFPVKHAS